MSDTPITPPAAPVGDGFESQLDDIRIKLQSFEGPLDLLVHLIKKHEINVYDPRHLPLPNQRRSTRERTRTLLVVLRWEPHRPRTGEGSRGDGPGARASGPAVEKGKNYVSQQVDQRATQPVSC